MTEPVTRYGIEEDMKDHEVRIRVLEKDNTETKKVVEMLCDNMKEIKSNTTWILRLIVGAILTALLGLIIYGG